VEEAGGGEEVGGEGLTSMARGAPEGRGDLPPWQGGSALEDLRNFVMSVEASHLDVGDLDLTIMGPAWRAEAPKGCSTREGGCSCALIAR